MKYTDWALAIAQFLERLFVLLVLNIGLKETNVMSIHSECKSEINFDDMPQVGTTYTAGHGSPGL